MVPALEHGEGGPPAEHRLDRVGEPGQVVVDQLGLQRQGGGGDHHRPVDEQRGRQVGQGLAGAGAGLDQQVLAVARLGDRLGHRLLARAGGAAGDRADGGGQQFGPAVPHFWSQRGGAVGAGTPETVPAAADRRPSPQRARRKAHHRQGHV